MHYYSKHFWSDTVLQQQDVQMTEVGAGKDMPNVRGTAPTSSAQPGCCGPSASTEPVTMQDDADHGLHRYRIWAGRCNETNSFHWSMRKGRARIALFGPSSCNLLYLCDLLGVRIFTLDSDNSGPKRMIVMASDGPVPDGTEGQRLFVTFKVLHAICFLTEETQSGPQLANLPDHVQREHSEVLVQTTEEKSILAAIGHHFRRQMLPQLRSLHQAFEDLVQLYRGYSERSTRESQAVGCPPRFLPADTPFVVTWTIPQGIVRDRILGADDKNLKMLASICDLQDAWSSSTPVGPFAQSDETPIYLKASDTTDPTADDVVRLRKAIKAVSAICTLFGRADLVPHTRELPDQLAFEHGPVLSDAEVSLVLGWQGIIGSRSGGLASNTDQDLEAVIREVVCMSQNGLRSEAQQPSEQSCSKAPGISDEAYLASIDPVTTRQVSVAKDTVANVFEGAKHAFRTALSFLDVVLALGAEDEESTQLIARLHESSARLVIGPSDSMSQVIGPEDNGSDTKTILESREAQAQGPKSEWQLAFEAMEMNEAKGVRTEQWAHRRQDVGKLDLQHIQQRPEPQKPTREPATVLNSNVQLVSRNPFYELCQMVDS